MMVVCRFPAGKFIQFMVLLLLYRLSPILHWQWRINYLNAQNDSFTAHRPPRQHIKETILFVFRQNGNSFHLPTQTHSPLQSRLPAVGDWPRYPVFLLLLLLWSDIEGETSSQDMYATGGKHFQCIFIYQEQMERERGKQFLMTLLMYLGEQEEDIHPLPHFKPIQIMRCFLCVCLSFSSCVPQLLCHPHCCCVVVCFQSTRGAIMGIVIVRNAI